MCSTQKYQKVEWISMINVHLVHACLRVTALEQIKHNHKSSCLRLHNNQQGKFVEEARLLTFEAAGYIHTWTVRPPMASHCSDCHPALGVGIASISWCFFFEIGLKIGVVCSRSSTPLRNKRTILASCVFKTYKLRKHGTQLQGGRFIVE